MQKAYFKMDHRPSYIYIKKKAVNLLEEDLGEYLHDLGVDINLLEKPQKTQAIIFLIGDINLECCIYSVSPLILLFFSL